MVTYHYTLGVVTILKVAQDPKEQAILFSLLKELVNNTLETLDLHKNNIKPLKGFNERVYELRKPKDYRIFYVLRGDEMIILHIIKKKKNYLEKRYYKIIEKRLKEI